MRIVNVVENVSEDKATKVFKTLCKYNKPFNECVLTYMGGNKFKVNDFSTGVEIECNNKITECVIYSINVVKKHLILGNILR